MRRLFPFVLIAAIIIGLIGYFMYNKSHSETKDAPSDVVISPVDLLNAYEADESAANAKYLDKIIEIKGKVQSINEVESGGSLSLDTGNEMSAIICEFESKESISGVKMGDEVVVKGFCSGKLMDIVLVRCSL